MPRPVKAPRLWLRKARFYKEERVREPVWVILDNGRQIYTGCGELQRGDAENAFLKYIEEHPDPIHRIKYVYFLSADHPGFPVKIGISESHNVRFSTLQTAIPYSVVTLAVVPTEDAILERRLHRKFAHIRLRGEWFERTPELMEHIASLTRSEIAA